MAKFQPKAAWPKGNAAGALGPMLRVLADMPAGRCFGDLFLRDREGSVYHPVDARGFLSLFEHLAMVWALGGHPETSAHPGVEGTRFRERRDHFGQAMGWLARKRYSRVGPGPRGMVWLVLRSIQGWRLPALRRGRAPQVFRTGYGRYPQRQILAGA